MPKYPFMQFYVSDYILDTQMLAPATRGVWVDLLCAMHQQGRTGELAGTPEELARASRCSVQEFQNAVEELSKKGVAEVEKREEFYSIINRRMRRECKERRQAKLRQEKHQNEIKTENKREINGKNNGDITGHISYSIFQKKENTKERCLAASKENPMRPPVSKKLDTLEFWEAWEAWERHWCEKGQLLTSAQRDQHMRELAHEETVEKAVETIRHSIQVSTKPILFKKWPEKQAQTTTRHSAHPQAQRINAADYNGDF